MDYSVLIEPSTIALVVIFVYFIVRVVAKKFLPSHNLKTLEQIATMTVKSAEQFVKVGRMKPADRKQYALRIIREELEGHGIYFNPEVIMAALESAVLELNKLK